VAAPAPLQEARRAPEAVARPAPEQTAPTKPPVKTAPKPKPVPPKPTAKAPPKTEPTPRAAPPVEPLPGEAPSTGADVATISTPGLSFPYPEYLRNIVQEVYRRWQRPLGNTALRSEVSFLVMRDGSVREIRLSRSSGSFSFDLSAQGAVEAAGGAKAFGPLPDGYPADVLPVSFYFTPRSQ
jgi:protein TonB